MHAWLTTHFPTGAVARVTSRPVVYVSFAAACIAEDVISPTGPLQGNGIAGFKSDWIVRKQCCV